MLNERKTHRSMLNEDAQRFCLTLDDWNGSEHRALGIGH
jgi:hypothetical protein